MRIKVYVALVVLILILGMVLNCCIGPSASHIRLFELQKQQKEKLQPVAAQYAERLLVTTAVEWQVYLGEVGTVYVDGHDREGNLVFKAVFDQKTGVPLRFLCIVSESGPGSVRQGKTPRQMAEFWLRHLEGTEKNPYVWKFDHPRREQRQASYWQGNERNVLVTVDVETGHLIGIRFDDKPGGQ